MFDPVAAEQRLALAEMGIDEYHFFYWGRKVDSSFRSNLRCVQLVNGGLIMEGIRERVAGKMPVRQILKMTDFY